jgi:hypothetical protein
MENERKDQIVTVNEQYVKKELYNKNFLFNNLKLSNPYFLLTTIAAIHVLWFSILFLFIFFTHPRGGGFFDNLFWDIHRIGILLFIYLFSFLFLLFCSGFGIYISLKNKYKYFIYIFMAVFLLNFPISVLWAGLFGMVHMV